MDVRNNVFLGCQKGSGLGSNFSTTHTFVDVTRSNPLVPHVRGKGGRVRDTRFDDVVLR